MTTRRRQSATMSLPVKIFVALVLLLLVVFPIIKMFTAMTADSFRAVFQSPLFAEAVKNSVVLSGIATVIVIVVAYLLAYCMERTKIYGKNIFQFLLVLPMLIPSISHGMGMIILFGGNGIIKNLLGFSGNIYGPVGIVMGSVLYAFPVAYIMLADVLKYEDLSVYEAADVLGIDKVRQFFRLTLPYMKKPLIAALFSTFSMIVTDYGVPLMIGGKTKTISLMMYEEVIGQLDFGKGCVYGAILFIPAVIAFVLDILNKERGTTSFVHREVSERRDVLRDALAACFCVAVTLVALLPIVSFLVLGFAKSYPRDMAFTFENVVNTVNRGGSKYLLNSFLMALLTAVGGTVLSYVTAYLTCRMRSGISRAIHLLALTFMAIPGIVLGLSYVISYSGSAIYGTMMILIMVNVAHFMSSPYLMMYNSFGKMNENLEAVGQTLGIGRLRMIKDVFLPQNVGTVVEMFSYLFVNCMMTISAVSFLANTSTKPISLMITQFESQRQYECAAIVSLMILLANVLVKLAVAIIQGVLVRKERRGSEDEFNKEAV